METSEVSRRFREADILEIGKITIGGKEYQAYLENNLLIGIEENSLGMACGRNEKTINSGLKTLERKTGVRFH